ncbi:GTPase ObgE [Desulfurispira natronophila]|uniref:GTPase Obg n=1 Tax=Desulfurispira natronophila TaxID=682562 RepID=A0A7W8DG36_9BACT|nr:GTPase ObgE [Desulfurispira natronophila]MBB5021076.1 GTP-binding protein [Desulfurispira natronophila]
MFLDHLTLKVQGGKGGDGCMSFLREKYVPLGGPNGGNGGKGGDVVIQADERYQTLHDFGYQRHYRAKRGQHGRGSNMTGRSGESTILYAPPGTIVRDAVSGEVLADLVEAGQQVVVAAGGRGGRGNAAFATPANKAPRRADPGQEGEYREIEMELKLLADVGLAGLPNAGKSTLISTISAARPKVADYPFTTLVPNLGVVKVTDFQSFVVADIPGLISGASDGAGLGHQFLRHIERTSVIAQLVDLASPEYTVEEAFSIIDGELRAYGDDLVRKQRILVGTKLDSAQDQEAVEKLQCIADQKGFDLIFISSITGENLQALVRKLWEAVQEDRGYHDS